MCRAFYVGGWSDRDAVLQLRVDESLEHEFLHILGYHIGVVEIRRQKTEQDRQFPGKMACCADDGASLAYAVELMQARTRIVGVGETKNIRWEWS